MVNNILTVKEENFKFAVKTLEKELGYKLPGSR